MLGLIGFAIGLVFVAFVIVLVVSVCQDAGRRY